MKQKGLFICTHNSAWSQMAEGLMNNVMSDRYEAYSAGTYGANYDKTDRDSSSIDCSNHEFNL